MNRVKLIIGIVILLSALSAIYPIYQIKSALGIDILPNHHAPDTLKSAKKAIVNITKL